MLLVFISQLGLTPGLWKIKTGFLLPRRVAGAVDGCGGMSAGAPSSRSLDPKEINPALCLPWVVWNRAFPAQHSQQMEVPTNGESLGRALPARLFPACFWRRNLHKFLGRQEP